MWFADALSVLLTGATILSYVPQYARIYTLRSSNGISLTATLLITLAAQLQLVYVCYAAAYILTPPSPVELFILAQITAQWACSLFLYVLSLIIVFPDTPAGSNCTNHLSAASLRRTSTPGRTAIAILVSHAATAIICVFFIETPIFGQDTSLAFLIVMFGTAYIAYPLATIATAAAFALQINLSKHGADNSAVQASSPNAISKQALALQSVVFLALAISWPFRPMDAGADEWWVFVAWYAVVGWASFHDVVIAAGQYIVLCVAAGADASGPGSSTGERQALLS